MEAVFSLENKNHTIFCKLIEVFDFKIKIFISIYLRFFRMSLEAPRGFRHVLARFEGFNLFQLLISATDFAPADSAACRFILKQLAAVKSLFEEFFFKFHQLTTHLIKVSFNYFPISTNQEMKVVPKSNQKTTTSPSFIDVTQFLKVEFKVYDEGFVTTAPPKISPIADSPSKSFSSPGIPKSPCNKTSLALVKKSILCEYPGCIYRCESDEEWENHVYLHSIDTSASSFTSLLTCPEPNCNYVTRTRESLRLHSYKHSGKIYPCDFEGCEYSSPIPKYLSRHRKIHVKKEKPIKKVRFAEKTGDMIQVLEY